MTRFLQSTSRRIILCFIFICLTACEQATEVENQQLVIFSGLTMGTTYTVKINSPESKLDRTVVAEQINLRLNKVNDQMSTYLETSDLSLFNRSKSEDWIKIPAELYTVIKESLIINKLSNYSFDITIGPVVNLWGFGPDKQSTIIPDETAIDEALQRVGSQKIHLGAETHTIRKDNPELTIDLSAIAKGFAVDLIAYYLDELMLNHYMVEIGGEIKTKGNNPNNKIWQIGIEKPLDDQRTVQTIVALENTGMATSGDYRNYFEKDGSRYSHTIDPSTGKPITHKLASVTVLHPSAMTADAMATAFLVLGPEQGFNLALKEDIAALFLVREKDNFIEKMTPRFELALAASK
ncbi:MAG: thiamine biosynthesis lipoprotein [Gammaproteobacteria bacterium]|jgi:thiamine biosynthesis lipoprotein